MSMVFVLNDIRITCRFEMEGYGIFKGRDTANSCEVLEFEEEFISKFAELPASVRRRCELCSANDLFSFYLMEDDQIEYSIEDLVAIRDAVFALARGENPH